MSSHSTMSSEYLTPIASPRPISARDTSNILALLQTSTSMHDLQTRTAPFTLPSPPSLPLAASTRGCRRMDPLELLSTASPSETSLPSLHPIRGNEPTSPPASAPAESDPLPAFMAIDPAELSARLANLLPEASLPYGGGFYLSQLSTHYSHSYTSTLSSSSSHPRPNALMTASAESFRGRNNRLHESLLHAEPTVEELYVDYDPRFSKGCFSLSLPRSGPPTHCLTPTSPQGTYARFLEDGIAEGVVIRPDGVAWWKDTWFLRYTEHVAVKAGICPTYARRQVERLSEGVPVTRWCETSHAFLPALEFFSRPWALAGAGRWKEVVERVMSDLENLAGVDGRDAAAGVEIFGSREVWEVMRKWRRGVVEGWRDRLFERCTWRGYWVLGRRGQWMDQRRRVKGWIRGVLEREDRARGDWERDEEQEMVGGMVVPSAGEMRRVIVRVGAADREKAECEKENGTFRRWVRWLVRYPVVAVRQKKSRESSMATDSTSSPTQVVPMVPAESGWAGRIRTDRDEYPTAEHIEDGAVINQR